MEKEPLLSLHPFDDRPQKAAASHKGRSLWLWSLVTVTVLLVVADLFFRIVFGAGNPVMAIADVPSGYILKPDQEIHRFGDKLISINSYGMRADPVPAQKPLGTERIFFIGDSVTYGSTRVDQNEIFSERIHHELPAVLHRPVQVLNGSASAWAIGNELGYLSSRGTFNSDLVILVLNSGDIMEPFATLSDVGEGVMTVKPWSALDEIYVRIIKGRLLHLVRIQDRGTIPEEIGPNQIPNNLALLTQFHNFVEAHRARMAIVFIPFRGFTPSNSSSSAPAALTEWSERHGVPLLDTTAVLTSEPVSAVSFDGFHLTSLGHRLVAQDMESHWAQIDRNIKNPAPSN
ncbi:MAG: SGNH/GDSL hydrolase family protein [Acidobacteria bacterium]|nr:SGNH/GDSL hydrolase family protein [Acidobacteriota bacterium]